MKNHWGANLTRTTGRNGTCRVATLRLAVLLTCGFVSSRACSIDGRAHVVGWVTVNGGEVVVFSQVRRPRTWHRSVSRRSRCRSDVEMHAVPSRSVPCTVSDPFAPWTVRVHPRGRLALQAGVNAGDGAGEP